LWRRRGGRRAAPFLTAERGQDPWTLAGLQESWLRCGRSVLEWYQLTPRETLQVLDAELTREQHAHERAAWSTWHTAELQRAKRMPAYHHFYRPPARRVGSAELARRRAEHQRMAAAYEQEQTHE